MSSENKAGQVSSYSGPPWVFDMLGMSPFWLDKAKELRRAAWLVWQGVLYDFNEGRRTASRDYGPDKEDAPPQLLPSVWGPFVLLAALAIENLLKGLLVIDHPEYVKDGKLRGEVITSHDLLSLAREAVTTQPPFGNHHMWQKRPEKVCKRRIWDTYLWLKGVILASFGHIWWSTRK